MNSLERLVAASAATRAELTVRVGPFVPAVDLRLHARDVLGFEHACDNFPKELGAEWRAVDRMCRGFDEVHRSVACLHNIPVYLRRFPYRDTGIARSDYLQYHYENWFNELYILDQRFRSLCTRIERAYRQDAASESITHVCVRVSEHLASGLEEARQVRGAHVHEWRMVDPSIGLLRDVEALATRSRDADAHAIVESEFRSCRWDLIRQVIELNGLLDVVIEDVCATLARVLLGEEGTLRPLPAV